MTDSRLMIGGNLPPGMTVTAEQTAKDCSDWMSENPVIETAEQATQAKLFVDRGRLGLADLEAERIAKTGPLTTQIKNINAYYEPAKTLLRGVLDELKNRLSAFIIAEESKRRQEIEKLAAAAAETERLAKEAEAREHEAIINAMDGELGIDIATKTKEADKTFRDAQKASHRLAIAARNAIPRIRGGITSRPVVAKNISEPYVADYQAAILAIQEMGVTEDIKAAIIKSARAYKRLNGHWPRGIQINVERKVQ